jgi:ATP/maltotriose-dependent transcriptional regulator MalT
VCRDVVAAPEATSHARAAASCTLGSILALRGDVRQARAPLVEAASIARHIELVPAEILTAWGLALADHADDDGAASAADRWRRILERWQRTEDRHYAISLLRWAATVLAEAEAEAGDGPGARGCAAALAQIGADARHPEAVSALAHALGETALLDGDAEQAALQFERAIELLHDVGAPFERLESERRAAVALVAAGRREDAVERLLSAYRTARRLRARPTLTRLAAQLAELGEPAERRLSRRQAEQLSHEGLTRRGLDVLRLVAVGRTNREIAGEVFVSPRTVDMHVRNLLRKLDCRSRADAARRALELGLVAVAHGDRAENTAIPPLLSSSTDP